MATEVIQLHIGQAGVQIANACWELYCLEHGINEEGCLACSFNDPNTLFSYTGNNKVVPRLIMFDSEPGVIDEVRTGCFRNLFHPSTLISGKDDCGNNFARGYYFLSKEMMDQVLDTVRKLTESCSRFNGFLIFRALGGGTGSGFGARLLQKLTTCFPKTSKVEYAIAPSAGLSSSVVEPYNALLSTYLTKNDSGCTCLIDNASMYNICCNSLKVKSPTFTNINRIIGQTVSTSLVSFRFEGGTPINLSDLQTNLIPFPQIHFAQVSYAPLISSMDMHSNPNVAELTRSLYDPKNSLLECNSINGKFISCILLYRGDVAHGEILQSAIDIKNTLQTKFLKWSPGIKTGFGGMPPVFPLGSDLSFTDKAACMLCNNTCAKDKWSNLLHKFVLMFDRKAFVYHYVGEGLEEGEMQNTVQNIVNKFTIIFNVNVVLSILFLKIQQELIDEYDDLVKN